MSDISNKVMNKVHRIYFMQRTAIMGLKFLAVFILAIATSTFVSYGDVARNFRYVMSDGSLMTYIADALSKTEGAVILLSLFAFVIGLALVKDLGKIIYGFSRAVKQ